MKRRTISDGERLVLNCKILQLQPLAPPTFAATVFHFEKTYGRSVPRQALEVTFAKARKAGLSWCGAVQPKSISFDDLTRLAVMLGWITERRGPRGTILRLTPAAREALRLDSWGVERAAKSR